MMGQIPNDDLVSAALAAQPEADAGGTVSNVEHVAQAIYACNDIRSPWESLNQEAKDFWRLCARSAIEANSQKALGTPAPASKMMGWTKVPEDLPQALLRSINRDNQVLAYENGRYYNAWFEFEQSEGGWFWTDEADSEPNPSHYRTLPAAPEVPDNG